MKAVDEKVVLPYVPLNEELLRADRLFADPTRSEDSPALSQFLIRSEEIGKFYYEKEAEDENDNEKGDVVQEPCLIQDEQLAAKLDQWKFFSE
jgi:hypothetical protein